MAEINWGLLQTPDIGTNALAAFEAGRETRRKEGTRNALATLVQSPDDQTALGELAKYDPATAMAYRKQQVDLAKTQQETTAKQIKMQSQLLGTVKDEATYQRALGVARQMGLPMNNVPQTYDPQFVSNSKTIADLYLEDGGKSLTNAAKQVQELGYDINTPEGKSVLAQIINAGFAKVYVDEQGRQRLYTGNNVTPAGAAPQAAPQMAPQAGPQAGQQPFTFEMFKGYRDTAGDKKAAEYIRRFGYRVSVNSPDEARQLPSGTPILLPDGTEGVVP